MVFMILPKAPRLLLPRWNGEWISQTYADCRHAATTQSFIPMGKTAPVGRKELGPGGAYIAVVALNGADDKPDLSTIKAFLVQSSQGVSFHAGVWRECCLRCIGAWLTHKTTRCSLLTARSIMRVWKRYVMSMFYLFSLTFTSKSGSLA
jgi:allantoicase